MKKEMKKHSERKGEREKEGRKGRMDIWRKKTIIFMTCTEEVGKQFFTQKKQIREETHRFNTVVKFENMKNLGRNSK